MLVALGGLFNHWNWPHPTFPLPNMPHYLYSGASCTLPPRGSQYGPSTPMTQSSLPDEPGSSPLGRQGGMSRWQQSDSRKQIPEK